MSFVCTRMSLICHSHVARMCSYVIRMSLVCHPYVTRMYSYAIRMYSYVIGMSLVCTRMSPVCHSYALVCHPNITRMSPVCHSYALVCHPNITRMSPVCHSYVLECHPDVTRLWFYHEPHNFQTLSNMFDAIPSYKNIFVLFFSNVALILSLMYIKCRGNVLNY